MGAAIHQRRRSGSGVHVFLSINRNKRSIVLDLKDAGDLAILERLIASADVLVENFRPGVMSRLDLGPPQLEALNPRLVTLSISGFGEGGPDGHRPGFDQILQGEAGLMSLTGPRNGEPTKTGLPLTDILAGMFGAYGVLAALHERQSTGRGQRVTTSLLAAAVAVHTYQGTRWTLGGEVPEPSGNDHPTIAPYGSVKCSDSWINIAVASERQWEHFATCIDLDYQDSRFATNADRVARRGELTSLIADAFERKTAEHWLAVLGEAGVPAGRIRSIDEVYVWPQVEHMGLIDRVDHPTLGLLELPGPPLDYSSFNRGRSQPPPLLDQHREDLPEVWQ